MPPDWLWSKESIVMMALLLLIVLFGAPTINDAAAAMAAEPTLEGGTIMGALSVDGNFVHSKVADDVVTVPLNGSAEKTVDMAAIYGYKNVKTDMQIYYTSEVDVYKDGIFGKAMTDLDTTSEYRSGVVIPQEATQIHLKSPRENDTFALVSFTNMRANEHPQQTPRSEVVSGIIAFQFIAIAIAVLVSTLFAMARNGRSSGLEGGDGV